MHLSCYNHQNGHARITITGRPGRTLFRAPCSCLERSSELGKDTRAIGTELQDETQDKERLDQTQHGRSHEGYAYAECSIKSVLMLLPFNQSNEHAVPALLPAGR